MRRTVGVAAALVVALGAQVASAGESPGLYLGAGGGADWLQDMKLRGDAPVPFNNDIDSDTGWAAIGTLGYRFGNGIRTEIEGGYRHNDADAFSGAAGSEVRTWDAMTNVLYDFDLGLPIRPYVGVGIGGINADAKVNGFGSDTKWAFGYQGIAGAEYPLSDTLALFADYRYLATQGLDLSPGTSDARDEYRSHTVLAGVRWTFWQPAQQQAAVTPPPSPLPAPAPVAEAPKNYTVFFDWDKSTLTPEALDIIRQAAANVQKGGVSHVQVTGHTDTSGSAPYNVGLSQRRAEAVAAELVKEGVPKDEIGVAGKGETDPLVPTGDNVKEPQNRRAVIELQQASS
ncbi:MAG TPA: OmpA family protein [Methylomirabilota bacterium]|nr:OmpA family protein [Methylomirabilota bacterium]